MYKVKKQYRSSTHKKSNNNTNITAFFTSSPYLWQKLFIYIEDIQGILAAEGDILVAVAAGIPCSLRRVAAGIPGSLRRVVAGMGSEVAEAVAR